MPIAAAERTNCIESQKEIGCPANGRGKALLSRYHSFLIRFNQGGHGLVDSRNRKTTTVNLRFLALDVDDFFSITTIGPLNRRRNVATFIITHNSIDLTNEIPAKLSCKIVFLKCKGTSGTHPICITTSSIGIETLL
mmetsp:Transcript_14543/g.25361  ORF Transcript_14543/g.25361 Transcript_14543/m.25361 type:complete len:137 (-) Transcript_14543:266-676(-)